MKAISMCQLKHEIWPMASAALAGALCGIAFSISLQQAGHAAAAVSENVG